MFAIDDDCLEENETMMLLPLLPRLLALDEEDGIRICCLLIVFVTKVGPLMSVFTKYVFEIL